MAKHRRQKSLKGLKRKQGKRPPYPRLLIVCEGLKTEPIYFEDIRKDKRIPSAHVVVTGQGGTAPRQIVDQAEALFKETREYEQVFAVFDRDQHQSYNEALQRAAQLDNQLRNVDKTPVRFQAIPSVPCFELWFLLHYRDVYEYYTVDDLLRLLQNHLPNYRKAREGIYADMQGTINQAMARACNLKVRYNAEAGDKPYTDFDDLVSRLLTLMNGEP